MKNGYMFNFKSYHKEIGVLIARGIYQHPGKKVSLTFCNEKDY
jgi:hypothetical protein